MKKLYFISLLIFGLLIIGCASVPTTPDGQSIEGVWMREDGAYFTFTGNKWQVVDMVNGSAAYGTFKLRRKRGVDFIDFKVTYNQNLRVSFSSGMYRNRPSSAGGIQNFQIAALQEFNRIYPEKVLQYDNEGGFYFQPDDINKKRQSMGSTGAKISNYILEGNKLILTRDPIFEVHNDIYDRSFLENPFVGTFIKQ